MASNQNMNSALQNVNTDYDNSPEQNRSSIDFRAMAMIMLQNWYWFVICIAISLTIAFIDLASTTPTYTREARMLIKDDNSQMSGSVVDIAMGRSKVNVENETRALRNSILVREVVLRLSLQDSYWAKQGLRNIDIYKKSPVVITPSDPNGNRAFEMKMKVQRNGDVEIWNVKTEENNYDEVINTKIGQTVKLPNGVMITITPGEKPAKEYYDTDLTFKHADLDDVTATYLKRMSIYVDSQNTTVVRILERGHNIDKIDDMLDMVMKVYNEQWIEDKNRMAVATSQFIDERLGVIEQELGNVDSDISEFKSSNLVPDVEAAGAMFMQQGNEADRAIFDLSNQISMARLMRQELVKGGIDDVLPATSGITNNAIQNMLNEFNQLVLERNRLLTTSTEKNPLVADLTNELRPMRQNIMHSLDAYISTLTTQMSNAEARASSNTSKIAASPKQAKYLLSVERQQKVKESLYLYLLQKREENQLGKAFTPYNTRIIENPGPSEEAPTPDSTKTLTIAFAIGFLVPLIFFYVRTFFDNKVRNKKDLEGISAPYLGEIPTAQGRGGQVRKLKTQLKKAPETITHQIVVDQHSRDAINEAFRVVRTNLEFMIESTEGHDHGKGSVLAITSANPGSGKTFITLNLASVMAIRGMRVAVLDLDLRRGSLSRFLGSPRPGITDYLIGKSNIEDIILHDIDGFNGMDAIPIGSVPPNPAELLSGKHLSELIAWLKEHYDYILLDCPPVEIVTDALIINKYSDRTIFVVRAGLFHKDMLNEIESFYRTNRYRNITVLLNGTDRYGGYGYNRYGYKYSTKGQYGYSDK